MADAYLVHHGVLGQKWGVRRYQNADGSYTTAGRKRLQINRNKMSRFDPVHKAAYQIQRSAAKGAKTTSTSKYVKQMTMAGFAVIGGVAAVKGFTGSESFKNLMAMPVSKVAKGSFRDKMEYGRHAAKAAAVVIGSGAVISAGVARGASATASYAKYITSDTPMQARRENRKTARSIKKDAKRSRRLIVYR